MANSYRAPKQWSPNSTTQIFQWQNGALKNKTYLISLGKLFRTTLLYIIQHLFKNIWQVIRLHYGIQTYFRDFDDMPLKPNERSEDLFQRFTTFMKDKEGK